MCLGKSPAKMFGLMGILCEKQTLPKLITFEQLLFLDKNHKIDPVPGGVLITFIEVLSM